MSEPRIGVLALQGAFREHCRSLERCGAQAVEVRRADQLDDIAGLVIPGGESTTIGTLLTDWNMLEPIRERNRRGMPIYGSCAGLILLCTDIENYDDQPRLGLLDATVRRNAFGRQYDSFEVDLSLPELGPEPIRAVFIRAPVLLRTGPGVTVLARVDDRPVAVRQGGLLATSFHPELTDDPRMHRYFLGMARKARA